VLASDGPNKKASDKQPSWQSVDLIAGIDAPTGGVICYYDFMLTVEGPQCPRPDYCSGSLHIGFTTHVMGVNQMQNLSVLGATFGIPEGLLTWSLSGGGSLNKTTGSPIVYTSPASNSGCTNNAIITLMCGGSFIDSLGISTNAVAGGNIAWKENTTPEVFNIQCTPGGYMSISCRLWLSYFYCDGTVVSGYNYCYIKRDKVNPPGGACPNDQECFDYTPGQPLCGVGNNSLSWVNARPNDMRTPEMMAAGCCPPQAL
jgi:hypothetical protein